MSLRTKVPQLVFLAAISGGVGYGIAKKGAFMGMEFPLKGTEAARAYADRIESKLQHLQIVNKLKNDQRYTSFRPWDLYHPDHRHKYFTSGALFAPGAITVPPLVFTSEQDKSSITIVHCGLFLAGFPFLVHGGILGTILDEAINRTAALSLGQYPQGKANLNLSYRRPTVVNQFLIVKTETVEDDGQAKVSGTIETVSGKTLVRGQGVFVSKGSFNWTSITA
jgi:hypothetical protein